MKNKNMLTCMRGDKWFYLTKRCIRGPVIWDFFREIHGIISRGGKVNLSVGPFPSLTCTGLKVTLQNYQVPCISNWNSASPVDCLWGSQRLYRSGYFDLGLWSLWNPAAVDDTMKPWLKPRPWGRRGLEILGGKTMGTMTGLSIERMFKTPETGDST